MASVVLLSFFSLSLCCLSFFDLRLLLSFCAFSLGHCVVCPSLIYGFCCPFVLFSLGDCVVCPSSIYGFCCPVVIFFFVIVLSVLLRSTVSVVLLSFFSWSLCCQLFLITPLVSSFTYRSKKISKFSLKLNVFVSAYNKEINMSGIYFQSRWNFMNMHTHMF